LLYDSSRHAIEVSRKNLEVTNEAFRKRVMEIIQQTEYAYWELAFARRELDVQLQGLEVARSQDESNRRQVERGQLASIEVVSAQTQLTSFEFNVYTAQDTLTRAENNLKTLMLPDRSAPLWTTALNPTTPPEAMTDLPNVADAITQALSLRPEMSEMKLAAEINQADQRLNREQLKPQVDLVAAYTSTGLAGQSVASTATNPLSDSLQPALVRINELSALAGLDPVGLGGFTPPPTTLVGGYGQSLNRLFTGAYPTTYVALRVSLPIVNRTAKANLDVSLAEGRRLEHQKHGVEQAIEAQVRNALQSIESARQRLQAARIKQQSAEQEYESEQRRFGRGASTLFLVQQRQLTTVTSQSQVYRAEIDLSEAISAYELAHGENYRRHNIVLK
jgi:HAE1 family hydrophobic/amphiphilic exporter-1